MKYKHRIIPIFIPHYGCKNNCVFCQQYRITGARAPAGAEDARAAVAAASADASGMPAQLAFYGGSFTSLPEEKQAELLNAAKPFLSFHPSNSIRISTRPDAICADDANRLKNFGVKTVEIGAQSMRDEVLEASMRGHTASDVVNASKKIKDAGLKLILQMMTGLPGDTSEKSIYTAKRLIELKPDGVRIYPAVVVRGTELYEMWKRGEYAEHTVEEAICLCAELCILFQRAGIPIIRLGINPTDELSFGGAVAGAYHPAFGQLVFSRLYYNKAAKLLENIPPGSEVTIGVHHKDVSVMTGQHRCNISKLMEKHMLRTLKVAQANIAPGEIVIDISK